MFPISPIIEFFESMMKAWKRGGRYVRAMMIFALLASIVAGATLGIGEAGFIEKRIVDAIVGPFFVLAMFAVLSVFASQRIVEREAIEQKIETVEQRVRENPEKPQLAWDLARVKLESYLDRNLSQVGSIFWLTLIVMICGFGFVSYGLFQASQNPEKLPISIVASASGVLISFIGGSFLLIYRSIMAQSKEYVTVLERINAVGMAVQVIASIPIANDELKSNTKAELAKQLLTIYAGNVSLNSDGGRSKQ